MFKINSIYNLNPFDNNKQIRTIHVSLFCYTKVQQPSTPHVSLQSVFGVGGGRRRRGCCQGHSKVIITIISSLIIFIVLTHIYYSNTCKCSLPNKIYHLPRVQNNTINCCSPKEYLTNRPQSSHPYRLFSINPQLIHRNQLSTRLNTLVLPRICKLRRTHLFTFAIYKGPEYDDIRLLYAHTIGILLG